MIKQRGKTLEWCIENYGMQSPSDEDVYKYLEELVESRKSVERLRNLFAEDAMELYKRNHKLWLENESLKEKIRKYEEF